MHIAPAQGPIGPQDEISLGELALRALQFYQRFARLLFLLAMLAALSVAFWMAGRPLYSVTALVEVPKITLEEWRQSQPFLWDQRWVNRSFNDDEGLGPEGFQLERRALNPEYWKNTVHYRASVNREDARDIPVSQFQNSSGLGLEFTLQVRNEAQANLVLATLTQHVREAFLANSLIGLIRESQAALDQRPQLRLDVLNAEFEIEQSRQRIEDMRRLLELYPETRHLETSTLFSVSDGGGKYLSPLPQIVALEATVSELQAKSRSAHRQLSKLDSTAQLLSGVDDASRSASSGEDILQKLQENREQLFAAHTERSASANEAAEGVNLMLTQAMSRNQGIGIKTRSAISSTPVAARNPLGIGIIVFLATFFGLSILLAIHVCVRKDRDVLPWIPRQIRHWLIVDAAP